ncbi:hypothetical protein AAHC03_05665 [Spirometra sp. Aus1]
MLIVSDVVNNGKNALLQTAANIEQAAAYCSSNYLSSQNQKDAIGETMNYATQSLGTMIHQLSQLATTFLKVLDEKVDNLASIEDKVSKLGMELKIRQEKVARKAIGSCTVSKVPVKYAHSKLRQEPPADIIRRPIDYSVLDHIGHGFKSQEPVNSSYGGQNTHAQTMSRRSSTTSHPMGCPGGVHERQIGTIDPKVLGPRVSAEYAASSIAGGAPGRFQSGTLGRTAGIYRSGVYGHQSIITSAACQLPANQIVHQMDLANPAARSNSPSGSALGVGGGTNSLGHAARRTNSASGVLPAHVSSQCQRGAGNFPVGGQQVDFQGQQQLRMPPNQLEQFSIAGYPEMRQPRSPGHQQPMTTEMILQRQQSEPAVGQLHHPPGQQQQSYAQPAGTPIHHFPNQYAGSQSAFNATDLAQETNKMKIHNNMPPPPPVPTEVERTAAAVRQSRVTSVMQAAAIDQLDSVVSMPLPPVAVVSQQAQHQAQPQQQEQSQSREQQASTVDISRLQPSPMDQLRPRRPDDAPWAPNQYIQKVITVYEYTADKNDELTFGENELIYVIKKNDDGWWEGVMSGGTGLFPGNYVESIE